MSAFGIYASSQSHGSDLGEDKLRNRRDRTVRNFFAVAVSSVVALVGFAGAAHASATIDLIWAATGTNQIGGITSPVSGSSSITLNVIVTAGPAGVVGAGVSVDYSGALSVIGYASTPGTPPNLLPSRFSLTTDTGSRIHNINAYALLPPIGNVGIGLPAGASAQLGTVTFHYGGSPAGTFEIRSDANGPTDGVLDLSGEDLTPTTTYNSAFLTVPEPTATPTTTPTATPTPFCSPAGASCTNNASCCSNQCSGPGGNKVCQPGPTASPTVTPSATPTSSPTPTAAPSATPTPIPTPAQDFDGDGVEDALDNCSERANPSQDDTDGDFCGNVCDGDYDQTGVSGFADWPVFVAAFGSTDEEKVHRDPVSGQTVGYRDHGFWVRSFNTVPGPSGTTPGTTACPL